MKHIQIRLLWLLRVLSGLLWLVPGSQAAGAATTVVIANVIVGSNLLPLWIANEHGLFAKQWDRYTSLAG